MFYSNWVSIKLGEKQYEKMFNILDKGNTSLKKKSLPTQVSLLIRQQLKTSPIITLKQESQCWGFRTRIFIFVAEQIETILLLPKDSKTPNFQETRVKLVKLVTIFLCLGFLQGRIGGKRDWSLSSVRWVAVFYLKNIIMALERQSWSCPMRFQTSNVILVISLHF